jgi:hypothetical protein
VCSYSRCVRVNDAHGIGDLLIFAILAQTCGSYMPWSESQHLRVWHPHWDVASTFLNIQRVICPLADDLCTGYDALHVCLVLARVSETTLLS